MSEAGKRLLDLPNCRPETHARHGGDHSMLCFIGAVPGLITMKEWERLDREREMAEAVAAERARIVAALGPPTSRDTEDGSLGPRMLSVATVLRIIEGETL